MENKNVTNVAKYKRVSSLLDIWSQIELSERLIIFLELSDAKKVTLFLSLSVSDQVELLGELAEELRKVLIRSLDPDDGADVIQHIDDDQKEIYLSYMEEENREEVEALMEYEQDIAGGLMNSRFISLRPYISTDVAIRYVRLLAKSAIETIHFAYVLDNDQRLQGVVTFRELLLASPQLMIKDLMHKEIVTVPEDMHQEEIARLFIKNNLAAIPVVDAQGVMKGIITYDDMVDVIQKEATEDIQKVGGTEVLGAPYPEISIWQMIRKRASWLTVLFVGEMFTASAMSYYEHAIQSAVVLALFIPLIISSGGNSGSQASTLIIRAMALGELKLKDWWEVFRKEFITGLMIGCILGLVGYVRIAYWPGHEQIYGIHYKLIAMTVSLSLVGVVLWGTITGSMLPFFLRILKLDPATASAPFVATIVDVTGIMLYFTVATLFLKDVLI